LIKELTKLTAADAVAKLLPLVTLPIVVRALGPETYGRVGFAAATAGFFALAASPGFVPWGIREAAKNPGREAAIASGVMAGRALFSVAAYALLVAYTFSLAPADPQVRALLLLFGAGFLVSSLSLEWLLTATQRFSAVAALSVVSQVIYAAAIVTLVRTPRDAWILPAAAAFASVVSALLAWRVVRRHVQGLRPSFGESGWRAIVPGALTLGLASLMSLTYDKVDMVLLGYLRDPAEVGNYAAAYKLMGLAMSFLPIMSQVFMPAVAAELGAGGQSHDKARAYLRLFWFASLPAVVGGLFVAGPLSRLVLGAGYTSAPLLFAVLLPNVVFGGLASYYAGLRLMVAGRNRHYLQSVASGAAVNVIGNVALIPVIGALAAAITTCLSQATVAAVGAWLGRDLPGPALLTGAVPALVAGTVMVASLLAAARLVPHLHVMALIALGAAIYLATYLAQARHRPSIATANAVDRS
jgi:O-antigen/teichoic acid export membrane protein